MKIVVFLSLMVTAIASGQKTRLRVLLLDDPKENMHLFQPAPADQRPRALSVENWRGVYSQFEVQCGEPSPQIEILGGLLEVPIFKGKEPGAEPWTKVTLPEEGDYLAVMVPSGNDKKRGWRKVTTYLISDEEGIVPKGSIRFVNVSEKELAVKIGDRKANAVATGASITRPLPAEDSELMMAMKDKGGKYKTFLRTHLGQQEEGVRPTCFLYENRHSRMKAHHYKESLKDPEEVADR